MRNLALKLIWFYQKGISPYFPGCCRFRPTCSQYACDAITQHGLFKGGLLTLWRLMRCHPLCRGGYYDPVPREFPRFQFPKARKQNG